MKVLNNRTEIAKAMNFGKYPVLYFDLSKKDEYGLKGCRCRVDAGCFLDGEPFYIDAELRVYKDEKILTTSAGAVFLSNDFGYKDYVGMVEGANAPLIGPDQDVVIAFFNSSTKMCFKPIVVHTCDYVRKHCQTPLDFEYVDMTTWLIAAGFKFNESESVVSPHFRENKEVEVTT